MPHLSRFKMNPEVSEKVSRKFFAVLSKAHKNQNLVNVLNELLTRTEKVMLAKRMAIILLLDKDIPQSKIVDTLKVSFNTVAKIALAIENGKYKNILKTSHKEKIDLEKIVWNMLTVGGIMPPKAYIRHNKKY
ncbi:MAG: hypothetical protein KBD52_01115 [Candidatus Pacebacteria bacterium]|nr:hypothetical protein [Candidatus Paceibacterota bacterium]